MKISNFTHGRDNNFNLIRIVAAFSVFIFLMFFSGPAFNVLKEYVLLSHSLMLSF
jgi:hypothetical protein